MSLDSIKYQDEQGSPGISKISGKPDTCPICHLKIDPIFIYAFKNNKGVTERLEIVFRCPNNNCRHLFIAYYYEMKFASNYFILSSSSLPLVIEQRQFSDTILKISKLFSLIYNQAKLAEDNGLNQICGGGYRRALEFLVKDYLISKDPDKEEKIKKLWLGKAVEEINSEKIKICAERAAWLGNDETHYVRKWEDKDIENLKDLIDLVVMWIDSEEKTKKYEKEMPKR